MRIERGCIDPWLLGAIREHVLGSIARVQELDTPARNTWLLQAGINLSDIPCPALWVLSGRLSTVVGLPCSLRRSSVRLQTCGGERQLHWHQDWAPMDLAPGQRGEVAWIPLDAISGQRPTIEIAAEGDRKEHERDERVFLVIPSGSFCGQIVTDLSVGDVVFFSPYEPHRTYIDDAMTEPRLSLDMRFAEGW